MLLDYLDEEVIDMGFYEFNEYWEMFTQDYLNDTNKAALSKYLGKSLDEITPRDYNELNLKSKKMFTDYVEEQGGFRIARYHDPAGLPSWYYLNPLSKTILPASTWIVHFTNHQNEIMSSGFTLGADDLTRLGVTVKHNMFNADLERTATEPGYNFGYTLDEDIEARAKMSTSGGYYGRNAVLFQSECIKVHHGTDNENQAVFWGPSVKASGIVPLTHTDYGWCAPHIKGGREQILDLITEIISGT